MSELAPDGSPVEFYRRIPALGEPELIHAAIAPGSTVLDIGCGPGRLAGPLVALGHRVTGVDNGAAMIAALPVEVEGIVGDGAAIRLGRRFGAVLLASHLVNDPAAGPAFVATAAAHVEPDGVVIVETYPPGWQPAGSIGVEQSLGDARVQVLRVSVSGDLLDAEVEYGVDGRTWQQPFRARLFDEAGLRELLTAGGLAFDRWLDRAGWFVARPARWRPRPGE